MSTSRSVCGAVHRAQTEQEAGWELPTARNYDNLTNAPRARLWRKGLMIGEDVNRQFGDCHGEQIATSSGSQPQPFPERIGAG